MSGHNKWSKIKNQKGATDQARGQLFTKLGNAITIAVTEGGGGNPDFNMKLRFVIEKARAANMPSGNIKRAIDRAVNRGKDEAGLESVVYEGFGPAGVAVLAEGLTDNKQRTASMIKNVFNTGGGTLGGSGSVSYLFEQVGAITIAKNNLSEDDILSLTLEIGAQDYEIGDTEVIIYTLHSDLHLVSTRLAKKQLIPTTHELIFRPKLPVSIDQASSSKIVNLLHALDELDDIQYVYTNAQFQTET